MGVMGIGPAGGSPYYDLFTALGEVQDRRSGSKQSTTIDPALPTGDVLELSAEAQAASDAARSPLLGMGSVFGLTHGSGVNGAITITDLQAARDQAHGAVQAKLQRLLESQGIDTSQEIRLQMAGDGRVIVASEHPRRAEIEKLFVDDPQLRNDYARFTALTEIVAAGHEAIAFQRAYAKDPQAAVAQYGYLFNDSATTRVSLRIENGLYEALYEGVGHAGETFE